VLLRPQRQLMQTAPDTTCWGTCLSLLVLSCGGRWHPPSRPDTPIQRLQRLWPGLERLMMMMMHAWQGVLLLLIM
jgi:hypothetical protein